MQGGWDGALGTMLGGRRGHRRKAHVGVGFAGPGMEGGKARVYLPPVVAPPLLPTDVLGLASLAFHLYIHSLFNIQYLFISLKITVIFI